MRLRGGSEGSGCTGHRAATQVLRECGERVGTLGRIFLLRQSGAPTRITLRTGAAPLIPVTKVLTEQNP